MIRRIKDFLMRRYKPIAYARKIGVNIGENCRLINSPDWGSEPWLISIGNRTEISFDCVFITHDGATWVFRDDENYGRVKKFGKIEIGNNCFVGARSIILPGVKMGDRSVVAAGSVVTKNIPAGEIWGGNPAKYITKVEDYAKKCLEQMPEYDMANYKKNKREEVLRVLRNTP